MPASSQASSALSTPSLIVVSSALDGLSKPRRWRFFAKNSEIEMSRCLVAISAAVLLVRVFAGALFGEEAAFLRLVPRDPARDLRVSAALALRLLGPAALEPLFWLEAVFLVNETVPPVFEWEMVPVRGGVVKHLAASEIFYGFAPKTTPQFDFASSQELRS